jgi:hypothetical protein
MIHKLSTGNRIALIAAIVALACVGALLSVGLVSSEPFSDATLGMDWQCSRVAFVMTTCRRVPHGAPVPVSERKETLCWRSA